MKPFPDLYLFMEPEYFGKIPVRTEVTVIPADEVMACPVCSEVISPFDLLRHCDKAGDAAHLAASVLES